MQSKCHDYLKDCWNNVIATCKPHLKIVFFFAFYAKIMIRTKEIYHSVPGNMVKVPRVIVLIFPSQQFSGAPSSRGVCLT